ncbi:MAG: nuclear transport factor 2 family protein [Sneathiellaceae bacterium]
MSQASTKGVDTDATDEGRDDAATALADRYIAMWNETDAGRRRDLIARVWAAAARYRDPMLSGDGHDGIDAMVQGVHAHYPGHRFSRTSAVESHNGRLRFGWALGAQGAAPLVTGVDFGVLSGDGRLQEIAGFFDTMPGAA